jgi:uncharacterized membrane protein YgcG
MKTISLPQNKYPIYLFLSILSVFVVSCGSYQNTSYFDTDGIYGNSDSRTTVVSTSEEAADNNQYKNYFGSLQDPNVKKDSTFTDVERYSSDSNNNPESSSSSAWGSDSGTTVVNIYDNSWGWNNYGWNNYWNWNIGWGWNSWYGMNYGWGWNSWYGPNWGWGWNSWYGNPWCGGYYQPYYQQYHLGTRSYAGVYGGANYGGNRNSDGRRYYNPAIRTATNNYSGTRNDPTIRNPRSPSDFGGTRNPIRNNSYSNPNNTTPRYNQNSTSRSPINTTRNYNSGSTRNYNSGSPRNNSSNSGSYNSGGRTSNGNYGGGRSYGGRR